MDGYTHDASLCQHGRLYHSQETQISSASQYTLLLHLRCCRHHWIDLSSVWKWTYNKVCCLQAVRTAHQLTIHHREGIQSYVMAAANSWGLFLVIVFMGYGLVSVPRSLWYSGSYDRHLFQHYANAARLKEECMDSELEFNELAKTMNAISKRAMMEIPEIRHCINVMNRRFPFVLHEAFAERDSSITIPRDLTEEYLVKISKRMILAIRMRDRKNA